MHIWLSIPSSKDLPLSDRRINLNYENFGYHKLRVSGDGYAYLTVDQLKDFHNQLGEYIAQSEAASNSQTDQ